MSDIKVPTPDNSTDDFLTEELLSQRKIFLFGELTDSIAEKTIKSLIYLSQSPSPISIFIHSEGGDVWAGCAIVDTINLIKTKITVKTICYQAQSAAADIFAVGSKDFRYIFPTAFIMLHKTQLEMAIDDEDKQHLYIEFMKEYSKNVNHMIAKACNKKPDKFIKDISQDLWLNAKDAVKYRIADKVIKDLSDI